MTEMETLASEFQQMKIALQEIGVVGNAYGKTAGVIEKQQGKLSAAFHKTPVVQLAKQFKGIGKQMKIFGKLVAGNTSLSAEEKKAQKKSATSLTKLTIAMANATFFGNLMAKMTANNVALWRRLTMAMMGIMSIFLLIGFAIAVVSVAFSGAETPLLDYTNGIPVLDEALKGLIMALTGEGEGGVAGAINVVALAFVAGVVTLALFGPVAAAIVASSALVVGAFQLVKSETDNTELAFAAAAATALILAGAILLVKAAMMGAFSAGVVSFGAMVAGVIAISLLATGLIVGGIAGLFAFATGEVTGWLGWVVGAIGAFLFGVGVAIVVGFTWPIVAIVAIVAFLVAIIIKYKDEIWDALVWLKDAVLNMLEVFGALVIGFFAVLWYGFLAGVGLILGVFIALGSAVIGVILAPILFIWNFGAGMWASFQNARKRGWKGIVGWLRNLPATIVKVAINAAKKVFNGIFSIYNRFAAMMTFEIPDWVPLIGGKSFKLPTIPKLAKGGIVNSPTLAMIGEDGPEAVIPLSQRNNPKGIGLGGNSNGPITININASGITDRSDKRALAREIGEAIREEMNRGGRSHGSRRGAL
tara:strand:- start:1328 stop:3091 length:1764 start_codon:yes stop_codon:yes gene_type:complete